MPLRPQFYFTGLSNTSLEKASKNLPGPGW